MRYHAFVTDYDGVLASHGVVAEETLAALKRTRQTGRKLILCTGREIESLQRCFPNFEVFDLIVAENGGLIFDPKSREEKLLCEPASEELVTRLKERGVAPLSVGRTIIA